MTFPYRDVNRTDMEIVKEFLKIHLKADSEIPERDDFHFPDVLFMIVTALNAKLVVELGTGLGGSCEAFLHALKQTGGMLYSVDVDRDYVKSTIEKYSKPENPVEFITGNSITVGENWNRGAVDVLYCDSNHQYDHVLKELETWNKYNPKIILIHDTLDHGEFNAPYKAAEEFATRNGKTFVNLSFTAGLGIIV